MKRSQTLKIEWNTVFEGKQSGEYLVGGEGNFEVRHKGRCKQCWGGLLGKIDTETPGAPTAICCLVCGILLEGEDAKAEYEQMIAESLFNIPLRRPPEYRDDATFVLKVFPDINEIRNYTQDEFDNRIAKAVARGAKDGWLTRSTFPAGSPGFFLAQAKFLMSGLERLPVESSVARFPGITHNDDGSVTVGRMNSHIHDLTIANDADSPLTVRFPEDPIYEHPKVSEYQTMMRFGSNITTAMMSAFASELAMKAIRLTRMDEARKSHDLWKLYGDLPADSRARIKQDFSEADSVLRAESQTFGAWRYFETHAGERGMATMIDTDRSFALAKAARVLIDEAESVGLGFSVLLEATRHVVKTSPKQVVRTKHNVTIKGRES